MRSLTTTTTSGTITAAGVSQTIAERNLRRDLLLLQNTDDAAVLYFAFGTAADTASSLALQPGRMVKFDQQNAIPTDAIYATADTTGARYVLVLGQTGGIE